MSLRLVRSVGHALNGIRYIVRTQANFRIHLSAAVLAIAISVALGLSSGELALIVLAISLVLIAEAANTAVEFLADEVSLEFRPGIGRAKDVAAGAVLIAAIGSVILALLLWTPRVLAILIVGG